MISSSTNWWNCGKKRSTFQQQILLWQASLALEEDPETLSANTVWKNNVPANIRGVPHHSYL